MSAAVKAVADELASLKLENKVLRQSLVEELAFLRGIGDVISGHCEAPAESAVQMIRNRRVRIHKLLMDELKDY